MPEVGSSFQYIVKISWSMRASQNAGME